VVLSTRGDWLRELAAHLGRARHERSSATPAGAA
jgi:hypothetical protein